MKGFLFSICVLSLLVECIGAGKAYYILFEDDITSSAWPKGFQDYQLFVTGPQNITKQLIQKVKADVPGSLLVAYWDFRDVPLKTGCSTGHVMGDRLGRNCTTSYKCGDGPWSLGIQSIFPKEWALNELHPNGTSSVICTYPGLAGYIPFQKSVDAIVKFMADFFSEVPFDGVYLDGTLRGDLYSKLVASDLKGKTFDCDGDGIPNTIDDAIIQEQAWAPYFMSALRKALGNNRIIIGNSAGAISDSALNGITIEMESCTNDLQCHNALLGQKGVSVDPSVGILWLTHSEAMPPAQQCAKVSQYQKEMPWLLAGTDFFDGSHVVCT